MAIIIIRVTISRITSVDKLASNPVAPRTASRKYR